MLLIGLISSEECGTFFMGLANLFNNILGRKGREGGVEIYHLLNRNNKDINKSHLLRITDSIRGEQLQNLTLPKNLPSLSVPAPPSFPKCCSEAFENPEVWIFGEIQPRALNPS